MQSMKGATSLLSGMNRQMNLPALQRIAMEFERENVSRPVPSTQVSEEPEDISDYRNLANRMNLRA